MFEYLLKDKDWFVEDAAEKLNLLGQEDWELVTEVVVGNTRRPHFVFVRLIEKVEEEPETCKLCKFFDKNQWDEKHRTWIGNCVKWGTMANSRGWCERFEDREVTEDAVED